MKSLYVAIISLGLTLTLVLLAGASAWGYYSTGFDHYVALAFGWPFIVASVVNFGVPKIAVAFAIYFVVNFAVVSILYKGIAAWRKKQ